MISKLLMVIIEIKNNLLSIFFIEKKIINFIFLGKDLSVRYVINICHWNYEKLVIDFFNEDWYIKSDFT